MSKKLIAVSLFTGAGGMDVGFERPGIKVVFANEVMKEAAQTYILIDFRAFYGLDKFSLKQIDQYVWHREGLLPEELRKESILSLIDKRSVFVW